MSGYTRTATQSFVANQLHDAFEALVEGGINHTNSKKFVDALPHFLNEFILGDVSTTTSNDEPGVVNIHISLA